MRIYHISIKHFRGIDSLDWHVTDRLMCLVGPGDSTKTTILDAVELALAPRWFVPIADADFYQADTDQRIAIEVTVGELPDELLADEKCGLCLRGYRQGEPLSDDPEDGWEPVITIRFQVTDDLEPRWEIVKDSLPDPRALSWRDRERLGMVRLGDDVERHLTWSRGSALAKITEKGTAAGPTLAIANRAANEAILNATTLGDLKSAAEQAREAAKGLGVKTTELHPGLDTQAVSFGVGALALHDQQKVPLRAVGLGTRRLAALAIQQAGIGPEAILLVDEIEAGLEPHRIRRLLTKLINDSKSPDDSASEAATGKGQVLMTTHSPTAIMALPVANLRFVNSANGVTTVQQVDANAVEAVQPIVRRIGHALLARKILVCEGKTEEALCRVLDSVFAVNHEGQSFAYLGVVPVNGGGRTQGPMAAAEFRRLGYDTAFVGDSDEPIQPSQSDLEAMGVHVTIWPDGMSTEERIATDLPWNELQKFVDAAICERDKHSILDSIGHRLGAPLVTIGSNIDDWVTDDIDDSSVRSAIGTTAKEKAWFKDLNSGDRLAHVAVSPLGDITQSPFAQSLSAIEAWIYAE